MSFRTALSVAVLVGLSSPCLASVACPSEVSGHRLRASGGGSLFVGPVADQVELAPDSSAGTPQHYVNVWRLRNPERVTLICHYEGLPVGMPFRLSAGMSSCRQDQSSFGCH